MLFILQQLAVPFQFAVVICLISIQKYNFSSLAVIKSARLQLVTLFVGLKLLTVL